MPYRYFPIDFSSYKDLFLKDLCARLPYVVKIKCNDDTEPYTLLSINWNKEIVLIGFENDGIYATSKEKISNIKPYLRPMSSMTEEEWQEYQTIKMTDWVEGDINGVFINAGTITDWLNKNMFDYHGLIEKGLAIEVTEENNPYKE